MKTKTKKEFLTDAKTWKLKTFKDDLIKNLNLIYEENENFECYLINILDNQELTDKEKIKLIREKI